MASEPGQRAPGCNESAALLAPAPGTGQPCDGPGQAFDRWPAAGASRRSWSGRCHGLLTATVVLVIALSSPGACQAGEQPTSEPPLEELSFDDLLSLKIVSASRTAETVAQAPATVIVLSRRDLLERGYTELSEILDDLPGMQVVRPYGATYLKSYWRGYRNTIGEPFLIMVDGVIMNHLYFNTADVMAVIPLSNVDRIEVVYGPASAVYGANAFMGVINVITITDAPVNGTFEKGFVAAGTASARLADVTFLYKGNGFRLSLAARLDDGDLTDVDNDAYEYTRNAYYTDRRLWGGFLDNSALAGSSTSPRENRAADLRVVLGDTEVGVAYYLLESGYGFEYAADRAQNRGRWGRPDLSAFVRRKVTLRERLTSTTLIRYRTSDVASDSYWIEGLEGSAGERLVQLSYWHAASSSWSVFQDFEAELSRRISLAAGLKYERKDLQKAYDIPQGPALPPEEIDAATYPYPRPSQESALANNRVATTDEGAYIHSRFRVTDAHTLHAGVRVDRNSQYGTATTVRAGYVGSFGAWTLKALAGDAFQEPNPRVLYGGWTGSGSDPRLDPERSRTLELSAGRSSATTSGLLSAYWVFNDNTIVNTTEGAKNLGDRTVVGMDLHLQALLDLPATKQLRLWTYATHLFRAEERKLDARGQECGTGPIGDLADTQVMAGVTATFTFPLQATLRARYVSARETVETNPVGRIPSWVTVDGVVTFTRLLATGLSASIKVTNIMDKKYFHPGVREANAGLAPGAFDEAGHWHGSSGYYSSLLPQPGRAFLASLQIDL